MHVNEALDDEQIYRSSSYILPNEKINEHVIDVRYHHSNELLNIKNRRNKKNKKKFFFPYLRDLKQYSNLGEHERISYLANNVINFKFKDLQSAILESKERKIVEREFEKCCLVLSFNLPKDLRKSLEMLTEKKEDNDQDKIESLMSFLDVKQDDYLLHKNSCCESGILSSYENDSLLLEFINIKEKEIKTWLNFEKFDVRERKYLIVDKSVQIFLNDLTKCLKNSAYQKYAKIFFEKFIIFFANYVCYLSGLKCYFSLDPFRFLLLEFYGDNEIYENLAEKYHYFLNLKIITDFKVYNYVKGKTKTNKRNFSTTIYDNEINKYREITELTEKNHTQYELINPDDVSFFTPYLNFSGKKKEFFRRYTEGDKYHDCDYLQSYNIKKKRNSLPEEISLMLTIKEALTLDHKCQSRGECSIFRNIDKLRLTNIPFRQLVNLKEIKKFPFFQTFGNIRNEEAYQDQFNKGRIFKDFLSPYETASVKKLNFTIRNYFGEKVGFYFVFTSHFIKWLLIPSLLSIVYYFLIFYLSNFQSKSQEIQQFYLRVHDIIDISFIFILVMWAIIYIKSWVSNQKFYNSIWGMDEHHLDQTENENSKIHTAVVYFNVQIPIKNRCSYYFKKILSILLSLIGLIITISINVFLFYVSNLKVYQKESAEGFGIKSLLEKKNLEVKSHLWYFLVPIMTVVLRNILSIFNYSLASCLCDFENHLLLTHYEDSFITKIIVFEFVNYYFNLFYIAYLKRYFDICAGNNCSQELGHQLVMIILTSNILNIFEIGIPFLNSFYKKNYLIKLLNEKSKKFEDPKLQLYYKPDFYDAMTYEYTQIALSYGYIILFGISSPICFFFELLSAWLDRLVDCYRLVKLHNVSMIDGCKGIGIILKIMKVFTFLGIITNTSIAFFNINVVKDSEYRWHWLFCVENVIALAFFIISYDSLPDWFRYFDQIRFNYVTKVLRTDFKTVKEKENEEDATIKEIGLFEFNDKSQLESN